LSALDAQQRHDLLNEVKKMFEPSLEKALTRMVEVYVQLGVKR
jgi:hypothetical protein